MHVLLTYDAKTVQELTVVPEAAPEGDEDDEDDY